MLTPTNPGRPSAPAAPLRTVMAARLRNAREIAGLSQADAGKRLGYTQGGHLSEAERGERTMPLERAVDAARLYGVSMDYLCGLDPNPEMGTAEARMREAYARMLRDLPEVLQLIAIRAADEVREDTTPLALADAMYREVLALLEALENLRAKVPEFNEAWPASRVALLMETTASAASVFHQRRARGRRILEARVGEALLNRMAVERVARVPAAQMPMELSAAGVATAAA